MQTIMLQGPSRDTVRLIHELALSVCKTMSARKTIENALHFQEMVWTQQDMAKKKEEENAHDSHQPNRQ